MGSVDRNTDCHRMDTGMTYEALFVAGNSVVVAADLKTSEPVVIECAPHMAEEVERSLRYIAEHIGNPPTGPHRAYPHHVLVEAEAHQVTA